MSPIELMGDLEVGLATVPFRVGARISIPMSTGRGGPIPEVVERCSEEMTGDTCK